MNPLRLALVDDHEMVLHGLVAMLGHFPEQVVIVGQATSASAALSIVAEQRPEVVLCDVRIGKESGLDFCREVTGQYPETKVVLLTVYDDEHYLYQALRVGASGYILKRIDGQELVGHLRRVREGETVIDHALAGRIALSAARLSAGSSGRARISASPSESRRCLSCWCRDTRTRASRANSSSARTP